MKTRIMILACLLAVPAAAWQHNNRLTLNRKLQYRHKATPSSSGKEKETCASRCTKSSWKTEKRKKYKFMKESISRKWMQTSALSSTPCHSSPKREDTMLTNRTVPVCILATAGWLTTSFLRSKRQDGTRLIQVMGIRLQHPLRISQLQEEPALGNQPGSQLGIPFFQYRR